MNDNFWFGVTVGFLLGSLFFAGFGIYLRDRGRDGCDAKLPRTEQCVQVWVPPRKSNETP
jgi:hypothetical protein